MGLRTLLPVSGSFASRKARQGTQSKDLILSFAMQSSETLFLCVIFLMANRKSFIFSTLRALCSRRSLGLGDSRLRALLFFVVYKHNAAAGRTQPFLLKGYMPSACLGCKPRRKEEHEGQGHLIAVITKVEVFMVFWFWLRPTAAPRNFAFFA